MVNFRPFVLNKNIKHATKTQRSDLTNREQNILTYIETETLKANKDNISRTDAYFKFYQQNKEIRWAFLASMVSRNAGWNMTDLEGAWLPLCMTKKKRHSLFLTYEKANSLIFADAFPQLLLFEQSKLLNKALFHLLPYLFVSTFMEMEWERFWSEGDGNRLLISQIINEQHIIQKPVIEHSYYKKHVFKSFYFHAQEWLHLTSVIFPTADGELYGFSVHDFTNVNARIELGKKLAWLLFHKNYYDNFYYFSKKTTHTGSRYDYEKYSKDYSYRTTPFLRTTFPITKGERKMVDDWYNGKIKNKWYKPVKATNKINITDWYFHKQKQVRLAILLDRIILMKNDH